MQRLPLKARLATERRCHQRATEQKEASDLELAASVDLIEALPIFFAWLWIGLAFLADRTIEVGGAFFVERAAPFIAVGGCLDKHVIDDVLNMPGGIGWHIAESHDELFHHPDGKRRQGTNVARELLGTF